MLNKSKLVCIEIYNLGCIGPEGLKVELDDMLCLVGANNCGKSTVLRSYELAVGNKTINSDDKCKRSKENENPKVILSIHIPKGMANIDERWKIEDNGLLLVKSKWEWDNEGKVTRQTWDPGIGDYAQDDKASGLDTVFSSRLPIPFRIGALDEPREEHKRLLTLILQPISERFKCILNNSESQLSKALKNLSELAKEPVSEEKGNLNKLKERINKSHNEIFPNLSIDFNIDLGEIKVDPIKLLMDNSYLKFYEWADEIDWYKQGTGSQRALFWSMMQARSELKAIEDLKAVTQKEINEIKKGIAKLEKEIEKVKTPETKEKKKEEIENLNQKLRSIENVKCEDLVCQQREELCLPGYMLLIDEPEIALHPNAIRAASKYLYNLSKEDSWQVMLTTHSPQFINPLEDHTTIVRLERSDKSPSPRTFRSDEISFDGDEKPNLQMLCQFDLNLAEMFFGQYPIIIEGDTEYAAFEYLIQKYQSDYPINIRPVLVRARGKYTMLSLIKILNHFKINFSVLHDVDYPFRKDGKPNAMWKANEDIFNLIQQGRNEGLRIVHRVSMPCFEIQHAGVELNDEKQILDPSSKEKPWNMLSKIRSNTDIEKSVKRVFDELVSCQTEENIFGGLILNNLDRVMRNWAKENKICDKRVPQ